jgi:hypothetical protein
MRSCPQALQQHPHQDGIGVALDPHLGMPKLDVNRPTLRNVGNSRLERDRCRLTLAHPHWQQLGPRLLLPKSSRQVKAAPAKHLIRIHTLGPRYSRHRCTWRQRLFHDPPLLRDASSLPLRCD